MLYFRNIPLWKRKLRFLCLILIVLFFSTTVIFASVISKQNIIDAILGKTTFQDSELREMDLNKDGKVDIADLVKLFHPEINFETAITEVSEGDTPFSVKIVLPHEFTGTINYEVGGTAKSGEDFTALTGTLQVSGSSAEIPINLVDDLNLENIETIILKFKDGDNYRIGSKYIHTINIKENDSKWYGTLNADNLLIGFQMIIYGSNGSYSAKIVSDGTEGLPAGEWMASNAVVTKDSFNVAFGPINVSAIDFLTGSVSSRTIELRAVKSDTDHSIDLAKEVKGDMEDNILMENSHLNTSILGTFSLIKDQGYLEPQEIVLEDVN